jgi:hypothetical protein
MSRLTFIIIIIRIREYSIWKFGIQEGEEVRWSCGWKPGSHRLQPWGGGKKHSSFTW